MSESSFDRHLSRFRPAGCAIDVSICEVAHGPLHASMIDAHGTLGRSLDSVTGWLMRYQPATYAKQLTLIENRSNGPYAEAVRLLGRTERPKRGHCTTCSKALGSDEEYPPMSISAYTKTPILVCSQCYRDAFHKALLTFWPKLRPAMGEWLDDLRKWTVQARWKNRHKGQGPEHDEEGSEYDEEGSEHEKRGPECNDFLLKPRYHCAVYGAMLCQKAIENRDGLLVLQALESYPLKKYCDTCHACGLEFYRMAFSRNFPKSDIRFCSQMCRRWYGDRTDEPKLTQSPCSYCLKPFEHKIGRKASFCSTRCRVASHRKAH